MLAYRDYTEDYKLEKKKLENLKKKQDQWKKMIPLGIVCLPIGVLFLRYVVVGAILFFANLFYGPVLIFLGLRIIWKGYINSDWESAIRISRKLNINTLEKEKEECAIRIGEWKRKIDQTERKLQEERAKYSDYSDLGGPVINVEKTDPEMDWLYEGQRPPESWENETDATVGE